MAQNQTFHSLLASAVRAFSNTPAPSELASSSKTKAKGKDEKVSRDFKGCLNCRVRRKKCEGPEHSAAYPYGPCAACRRLSFTCLGYPGLYPDWAKAKSDASGEKYSMRYEELKLEMQLWIRNQPRGSGAFFDLSKYLRTDLSSDLTPEELIAHEERVRSRSSLIGKPKAAATATTSTTGARQRAMSAANTEPPSSSRRGSHVSRERTVNEVTKRRGSATSEYAQNMHVFSSRPSKPIQPAPSKPPVSILPKHRPSSTTYTTQVHQSAKVVPLISVDSHIASVPSSTGASFATLPVWYGSDERYPTPYLAPHTYSSGTSEYSAVLREGSPSDSRRSVTSSLAYAPNVSYHPAANPAIQAHQDQGSTLYAAYGSYGPIDSTGLYQYSSEPVYNSPIPNFVQPNSYPHQRSTGSYVQRPDWC